MCPLDTLEGCCVRHGVLMAEYAWVIRVIEMQLN